MQPRRLGPYVLEAPLGEGGMATVWRGRHAELGAVRAVKLVTSKDPASLLRFSREASRLASLRHPNIVAIHETGTDPAGAWFAMDLLEGETLAELLTRGRLPVERALDVVIQAARGVDALHGVGVVHRDLKPQNILVERGGRVVVLDLGLALAPERDERLTITGAVVGTVLYLAPEQLDGTISPAVDVHALGLVLYEALTGQVAAPLGDAGPLAALAWIASGERRGPCALVPTLPAALDAVVLRAVAIAPAARFPRAGALADALERVRANPGQSAVTLQRARRATGAAGGLGLLLLVVAVTLALSRSRGAGEAVAIAAPGSSAPTAVGPSAEERARLADGEREARAVRRLPAGQARLEATAAWLTRFPDHTAAPELRALHASDAAALVLAWLTHDAQ